MNTPKALLVSLAMITALAACGDEAPNDEAVSAMPAPAAEEAIQETPAFEFRSLEAMDDVVPGVAYGFNAEELDAVSLPMHCSLDSVNRAAPGSSAVPQSTVMSLSGWTELDAAGRESDFFAVLEGTEDFVFRALLADDRPDLAGRLDVESISDMNASTDLTGVPAGEYNVYFVRVGVGQKAKCVADDPITIE